MKNNQIWIIVGVSLVVAIVASIATASITGNVIKLNQDRRGNYEVYTKAEVDAKISAIQPKINYTEISSVFGTGGAIPYAAPLNGSQPISCNQMCLGVSGSCVGGIVTYKSPASAYTDWRSGVGLATCLEQYDYREISSIQCRCIQLPN